MSCIACTSDCVYQEDGVCNLERAASSGAPDGVDSCVHYIKKTAKRQSRQKPQL